MSRQNIINDNIFNKDTGSHNIITGYSGVNGIILPSVFPALELNGRSTWQGDGIGPRFLQGSTALPSTCTIFLLADREVAYSDGAA